MTYKGNTKNFPKGAKVRWRERCGAVWAKDGHMIVEGYNGGWCMVQYVKTGRRDGHPDELLELVTPLNILPEELFHV